MVLFEFFCLLLMHHFASAHALALAFLLFDSTLCASAHVDKISHDCVRQLMILSVSWFVCRHLRRTASCCTTEPMTECEPTASYVPKSILS